MSEKTNGNDFSEIWNEKSLFFQTIVADLSKRGFFIKSRDVPSVSIKPDKYDKALLDFGELRDHFLPIDESPSQEICVKSLRLIEKVLPGLQNDVMNGGDWILISLHLAAICSLFAAIYRYLSIQDSQVEEMNFIRNTEQYANDIIKLSYEFLGRFTTEIDQEKRDINRRYLSGKEMKALKEKRKRYIVDTYFHTNTDGMRLHQIAVAVKKNYPYDNVPAINTIKNHLDEYYQEKNQSPPWVETRDKR